MNHSSSLNSFPSVIHSYIYMHTDIHASKKKLKLNDITNECVMFHFYLLPHSKLFDQLVNYADKIRRDKTRQNEMK